jgi:hypothetical protein
MQGREIDIHTDRSRLPLTRDDVLATVKRRFPHEEPAAILAVLDAYGTASYERERERVQVTAPAMKSPGYNHVNAR